MARKKYGDRANSYFRAAKYLDETLELIQKKPGPILIQQIFAQTAKIGGINIS